MVIFVGDNFSPRYGSWHHTPAGRLCNGRDDELQHLAYCLRSPAGKIARYAEDTRTYAQLIPRNDFCLLCELIIKSVCRLFCKLHSHYSHANAAFSVIHVASTHANSLNYW